MAKFNGKAPSRFAVYLSCLLLFSFLVLFLRNWHISKSELSQPKMVFKLSWDMLRSITNSTKKVVKQRDDALEEGLPRIKDEALNEDYIQTVSQVSIPDLVRVNGENIYLIDVVIAPRYDYIYVSALMKYAINSKKEYNVTWLRNDTLYKTLTHPCTALKQLQFNVNATTKVTSVNCEKHVELGGNIRNKGGFARFHFKKNELRDGIEFARSKQQDALRVVVGNDDERHPVGVDVLLKSRAAGLFKHSRREGIAYSEQDYAPPFEALANSTDPSSSICLKLATSSNPYLYEVATYFLKVLGLSHLYIGVLGQKLELEFRQQLKEFYTNGQVSLIQMNSTPGVLLQSAKVLYLNSCLHTAKQVDLFVGAMDMDEMPVIYDQAYQPGVHLGKYIAHEMKQGNVSVGPIDEFVPYKPPTGVHPHPVSYYCEIILQGHVAVQPPEGDIKGKYLWEDFPLRTTIPRYFHSPLYMKTIAVAPNVNILEIHKHTNCDVQKGDGVFRKNNMRQIPKNRRMYPDGENKMAMMHFANTFRHNRYKIRGKPSAPNEYAALIKPYFSNTEH